MPLMVNRRYTISAEHANGMTNRGWIILIEGTKDKNDIL